MVSTYIDDLAGAKAGTSIEPVIVSELVDLDPLLIVGQRRLDCHPAASQQHTASPSATGDSGYDGRGRVKGAVVSA